MDKKLFRNYAYSSIYQILILFLPLILTPFLTRVLGAEAIGQYSYTRSVVTYFILFGTVGSNMYAQREIAYAGDDKFRRSCVFWEILAIRFFLLGISLSLYFVLEVRNGRYPLLFLIQSMDIIASMLDITWYFQGLEDFGRITLRNVCIKICSVILILVTVRQPSDLWLYVFIYTAGNLLGQMWLWKDIPHTISKIPLPQLHPARHRKGILLLFIPQIAIQIYLVIDKTMIQLLTNDSLENGYYELAQTIQRTGVTLTTAYGSATAARVALLKNKPAPDKEIAKLITESYEIVCLAGVPVAMGLGAIARNLIPWFMGTNFQPVARLLIQLSPLIVIIGFSNISGIQYMVPMGLQNRMTVSTLLGMILNICLNLLWIPAYKAQGAAGASVAAECAVALVQIFYIRKILRKKLLIKSFSQAIISGSIMVILVKITEQFGLKTASFPHTVLLTLEGACIYLAIQLLLGNRILLKIIDYILSVLKANIKKKR